VLTRDKARERPNPLHQPSELPELAAEIRKRHAEPIAVEVENGKLRTFSVPEPVLEAALGAVASRRNQPVVTVDPDAARRARINDLAAKPSLSPLDQAEMMRLLVQEVVSARR